MPSPAPRSRTRTPEDRSAYAVLLVSRVVLGLAVGVSSIIVPLYIAEMAPADIRGRLVSLNSLMIVTGQLLAYLVNAWLAQYGAWRWMLGLAAVPAVVLVVRMFLLPGTPTWYRMRDRADDVLQVLRRAYPEREAHRELGSIGQAQESQSSENQGWRGFREPWIRRSVLIAFGVAVLQQATGVNTVIYFAPTSSTRCRTRRTAAADGTRTGLEARGGAATRLQSGVPTVSGRRPADRRRSRRAARRHPRAEWRLGDVLVGVSVRQSARPRPSPGAARPKYRISTWAPSASRSGCSCTYPSGTPPAVGIQNDVPGTASSSSHCSRVHPSRSVHRHGPPT